MRQRSRRSMRVPARRGFSAFPVRYPTSHRRYLQMGSSLWYPPMWDGILIRKPDIHRWRRLKISSLLWKPCRRIHRRVIPANQPMPSLCSRTGMEIWWWGQKTMLPYMDITSWGSCCPKRTAVMIRMWCQVMVCMYRHWGSFLKLTRQVLWIRSPPHRIMISSQINIGMVRYLPLCGLIRGRPFTIPQSGKRKERALCRHLLKTVLPSPLAVMQREMERPS